MAERKISDLDGLGDSAKVKPALDKKAARDAAPAVALERREELVDVNYPEPTTIARVVRDVARWSGKSFVMEPRIDARIQIFAPQRLRPGPAYELFLASLSILSLRAVQIGSVVKIVPIVPIVAA